MKLAVVGATGLVGKKMIEVLEQRNFPATTFFPVASEKSVGKKVLFQNKEHPIISLEELLVRKPDLALFSAGSIVSKEWAPKLAENGARVIDNSSYWRMCSKHKLIIPEINGEEIEKTDRIIANPNCSTIQMLIAITPLHKKYKIKRIVISTYQSISGTGIKAIKQYEAEKNGLNVEDAAYPFQIYNNILPHIDEFLDNNYTKEEMKLLNETNKILDKSIKVTATAVRVPVLHAHSESLNIEFQNDFNIKEVKKVLSKTNGVNLQCDALKNIYPMPINAKNSDLVFVGRIRRDFTQPNTLNMWVVSDNLRKGAATNAIQIAEYLLNKKIL